ncbi:MAG: iron chelate uptake ABC transporter family permease subunit, partial [Thermodesulfovibrionales bacterium]
MKAKSPLLAAILLSPFLAGWLSLFLGAYSIEPLMVLEVIFRELWPFAPAQDLPEKAIIMDIRLPRVILAGLVGLALSGSGATLQGIFRNPLVDPFIMGISAGAALGCALSVGFFPQIPIQVMAFCFSIIAVI